MAVKLRIRPYRAGDELAFEPRADFAEERAAMGGAVSRPAWAIVRWDGEVVGIGGAADQGAGIWDAWCSMGQLRPREWVQAAWLASRALSYLERQQGARVIRAGARLERPAAVNTLRKLGFVEASMGEDPRLPGVAYLFMQREAA
jgi:hypothetical protein